MFVYRPLCLVATGILAGCTAGAGPAPAAQPWDRLTGTDNGLELRQWLIADESQRIASTLAVRQSGQVIDDAAKARLRRNGFWFVQVPLDELDALLDDLGGATLNARVWHGQVLERRELLHRPVPVGGQVVAIDGRVRRYEGGEFRLMLRSWVVQMEDGPYLHVEIVPHYRRAHGETRLPLIAGRPQRHGERLVSMRIDALLRAGSAYVLVGASPGMSWPGDPPRAPVGPPSGLGPEGQPPPAVGELLLSGGRGLHSRGILVLVPVIAPELFPEPIAIDAAATGE